MISVTSNWLCLLHRSHLIIYVQLHFFEDEINADERWRLTLDPRLHRPQVTSNREWLTDLAEYRLFYYDMLQTHDKLLQSRVLFHDVGTTIAELRTILRNGRVGSDIIDQLIRFLSDRSKFVELVRDKDLVLISCTCVQSKILHKAGVSGLAS